MRQPTARTWAILELARRAAEAQGTTTEVLLAMAIEAVEDLAGERITPLADPPPERDPTGW